MMKKTKALRKGKIVFVQNANVKNERIRGKKAKSDGIAFGECLERGKETHYILKKLKKPSKKTKERA